MSSLLERASSNGLLEGFVDALDKIQIFHLQFADDTILFCQDNNYMINNLVTSIEIFEVALGLKVNWEKSAISGINLEVSRIVSLASRLNCKVEHLPIKYLGLPLGEHPQLDSFWLPVMEKILKKLDRWNKFSLSKGGRLTLLQLGFGQYSPLLYVSYCYA